MATVLDIDHLVKRFGAVDVLKDISLKLDEGEFLVLVGPSGCGKSTLLNCIAGLSEVTGGTIAIAGRDMTHAKPADRDIAMVFQSYALFPNMSVADNIGFGLDVRRTDRTERDLRISEVASLLKIDDYLQRRPAALSGGQRQRVAMGRALVRQPRLFLFDEPLSNLDTKLRGTMRTEIKRLHRRLGTTIVYVTHDQIEAMTLATRIAVLRDGEIQQLATPREIYDRPANMFVADFMGTPAMNLIHARVVTAPDGARLSIATQGGVMDFHDPAPPAALSGFSGREIVVGLRPEAITDTPPATAAFTTHRCMLDVVEPTGSDTFAVMHLAGADVVGRFRADSSAREDAPCDVHFDLSKAVYFDPATGMRIG